MQPYAEPTDIALDAGIFCLDKLIAQPEEPTAALCDVLRQMEISWVTTDLRSQPAFILWLAATANDEMCRLLQLQKDE